LISLSADGNKIVYYEEQEKKYYSHNFITNKKLVFAKDIKFPLFDEENDVPDDPNAYGIAKWMNDHRHLIVYDKFDLWLVDAEAIEPSVLLTNGRKSSIVYRFIETNEERKAIAFKDALLLKGYNEINKSESISYFDIAQKQINLIQSFDMHITNIVGTKNINDLIVLKEDEHQAANIYLYQLNNIQQDPKAIAQLNIQQASYNWLNTELIKWKAYTGKSVEGILYKPEDFDPKKKYPMIVYFYERNNQTLHNYIPPTPTGSRLNISFFVSRGYLVFVPDIWYKNGYPGQSAYDHIVSGTKALIQKGFVDSTKIGLQGQSWGGYQIAYLITKTNMYAAAWAGAPVVNMTSAYGGIRWGTGMNRQFQYEKTQSRIGATLWERPDLYLKNSPLFELPKVQTPLVIMSNDADDAVPWYQGIEMFTAMKRLNKKVWLLVYNNEFHNLVERKNKKDIQIREQQFFDHYLKGAAMPVWMSKGVPATMKGRTMGL
jgi:dipeptidyl aminopeptidase/acylaminoacyl peptidase